MANDFTRAEQAGKDYFRDHPASTNATATRVARKQYAIVLQRELFVAGWNNAFWDEQSRFLKASRQRPDEEPPQPVDDGSCDPLYGQRMDSADMGEC